MDRPLGKTPARRAARERAPAARAHEADRSQRSRPPPRSVEASSAGDAAMCWSRLSCLRQRRHPAAKRPTGRSGKMRARGASFSTKGLDQTGLALNQQPIITRLPHRRPTPKGVRSGGSSHCQVPARLVMVAQVAAIVAAMRPPVTIISRISRPSAPAPQGSCLSAASRQGNLPTGLTPRHWHVILSGVSDRWPKSESCAGRRAREHSDATP